MGKASRDKGARWARATRGWLEAAGHPVMARSVGEDGDDLTCLESPLVSIECKDIAREAWGAAVTQADKQARPEQVPMVWAKQRGKADPGEGYLIIRARHLPTLIDALEQLHLVARVDGRHAVFLEPGGPVQPPSLGGVYSGQNFHGLQQVNPADLRERQVEA